MQKILFYGSLTGLVASAIVHLYALTGIDLTESYPFVMGLHAGIFVVIIPTVLMLKKNPNVQRYEAQSWNEKMRNPFGLWKVLLNDCPLSFKLIAGVIVLYAFASFLVRMATRDAMTILLFSGHWMAIYALLSAITYPYKKNITL